MSTSVVLKQTTDAVVPDDAWDGNAGAESTSATQHVHCLNPLKEARWNDLVEAHPRASVFHSTPWLDALYKTYGYEPVAYTTSPAAGALENAIVFCRVESWLTGRRLVSLPFSDHCQPLAEEEDAAKIMARTLEQEFEPNRWRYVEMRPLKPIRLNTSLHCTKVTYAFHQLNLEPNIDLLFHGLHKSSIQRKIHRAEREGLQYREGSDEGLLDQFYGLFQHTRERHKAPPQPRQWFVHLMECFGNDLRIRVARQNERPVAAMITLRHKDTLVYKYGCSDPRYNNLGSMHLLYWRAIQEAKSMGLRSFDFGRTDADQAGLINFKNRWGASQSVLTYSRYGKSENSTHFFDLATTTWKVRTAKYMLSHLPSRAFSKIGQVLYRHIG